MAGTRNSSIGPPWGIDLMTHHIKSRHCTTKLHLAPAGIRTQYLLALNPLAHPLQLKDWSIDSTTELHLAPAGIRTQYLLAWNPLPQPLQMSVNTDVSLPPLSLHTWLGSGDQLHPNRWLVSRFSGDGHSLSVTAFLRAIASHWFGPVTPPIISPFDLLTRATKPHNGQRCSASCCLDLTNVFLKTIWAPKHRTCKFCNEWFI